MLFENVAGSLLALFVCILCAIKKKSYLGPAVLALAYPVIVVIDLFVAWQFGYLSAYLAGEPVTLTFEAAAAVNSILGWSELIPAAMVLMLAPKMRYPDLWIAWASLYILRAAGYMIHSGILTIQSNAMLELIGLATDYAVWCDAVVLVAYAFLMFREGRNHPPKRECQEKT